MVSIRINAHVLALGARMGRRGEEASSTEPSQQNREVGEIGVAVAVDVARAWKGAAAEVREQHGQVRQVDVAVVVEVSRAAGRIGDRGLNAERDRLWRVRLEEGQCGKAERRRAVRL